MKPIAVRVAAFCLAAAAAPLLACATSIDRAGGADPDGPLGSSAQALPAPMFQVGFARVDVTPDHVLTMGGYGSYFGLWDVSRKSTAGVHDPLYASAMAVRGGGEAVIALASVDSVGLSSASVRRIRDAARAQLGSGSYTLHVAATHSHQAPDTMGIWGTIPVKNGRDASYMAALESGVAASLVQAVRAMQPASLSWGTGSMANSHDTEAGADRHDDAIVTLLAKGADGGVLGTFTQWSAHPTTLPEANHSISADYVGTYRYYMEQARPGVHVYVNGALGGTYAVDDGSRLDDPFVSGAHDAGVLESYRAMAAIGHALFEHVDAALGSAAPLAANAIETGTASPSVFVDNAIFLAASSAGIIETRLRWGFATTEIDWFRIGEIYGATVPGEMFPDEGNRVRAMLAQKGAAATVLVGMGDDWLGYLMSPAEYSDPAWSYNKSLCASKGAADGLVAGFRTLLR